VNDVQPSNLALTPAHLRRLKVFADMTEDQARVFLRLIELCEVDQNRIIVKKGDAGDCMYLLFDGEVRVSEFANGRETILATLETGDFFGEIALFSEGPRCADVVAKRRCKLLKLTRQAFMSILDQYPAIAAQFLLGVIRSVATRLRTVDKKYIDSMLLSRFWARETPRETVTAVGKTARR